MRRASTEVTITAPSERDVGYLAGIMDGEGYFSATPKTRSFGIRVAMTDACVIDWLHATFNGTVSRAGMTTAGNQVHTWTLSRQADLRYVLNRLLPSLVCKRAQAEAMLQLLEHLATQPQYEIAARTLSNVGRGGEERERRRIARAAWTERALELRAAIPAAR